MTVEDGPVIRALLGIVFDGTGEPALAGRICRAFIDGLDVDGAAMSLLTASTSRQTLWASDATGQRLEDLQFTLGEGACIDAATSGRPVLVGDLTAATETARWPLFAAHVADRTSIAALFALPLRFGAATIGVIDLYRRTPGELDADQLRDALSGADTAASILLSQRIEPGRRGSHEAGLFGDGRSRQSEIHQATGMVAAQLHVSPDDALARLRGHAFTHDRLLVEIAQEVIGRRLAFEPDMT